MEPEATLVVMSGNDPASAPESLLVVRPRDPIREKWDGPRVEPLDVPLLYGVDRALVSSELASAVRGAVEHAEHVYYDEFVLSFQRTHIQMYTRAQGDAGPHVLVCSIIFSAWH